MENNKISYIKTDKHKIINEKYIRWIRKMDECLEVCIKSDGCIEKINTHTICKLNNPESYKKLSENFE